MAGPRNQIAKRQPNAVVLAPLTVAAVRALVNSRGADYVLDQVSNGLIRLSKAALAWLTSAPVPVGSEIARMPAPANIGTAMTGSAKFQGDIRLKHRELLISGNFNDGSLRTYRVNPVDAETFPYLSNIANNYDEYKFHSIKFGLVSSSPTSSGGRWYMAWDPDSTENPINSSQYFMQMQHSLSASAWQSGDLSVPGMKDFKLTQHFPNDLKDHGQLLMRSTGTTEAFDLYIEYDVTLRNPEVGSSAATINSQQQNLFTTSGFFVPLGPDYVRPTNPLTSRAFELASGYWQITTYTIGTGLALGPTGVTNATQFKERRAAFSTTESWSVLLVNCAGVTESAPCQVVLGSTWTTISGLSCVITPLTIGQYNSAYSSMP